jgi:hypothetical protein
MSRMGAAYYHTIKAHRCAAKSKSSVGHDYPYHRNIIDGSPLSSRCPLPGGSSDRNPNRHHICTAAGDGLQNNLKRPSMRVAVGQSPPSCLVSGRGGIRRRVRVRPGSDKQQIRAVASGSIGLVLNCKVYGGLGDESWGLAPAGAATRHWRPWLGCEVRVERCGGGRQ